MNIAISSSILSLFLASIVITNQQIHNALPVGLAREDVESYLVEVGETYEFITRETDNIGAPAYPWIESEIGHYRARVGNVRASWWRPSFGRSKLIRVGINRDNKVSQVIIRDRRSGFP